MCVGLDAVGALCLDDTNPCLKKGLLTGRGDSVSVGDIRAGGLRNWGESKGETLAPIDRLTWEY